MSNSTKSPPARKGQDRRPDVYQIVTDQVIELLEKGEIPWHKPWRGGAAGMPKNAISNKPYRGINVFMLAMTAEFKGYDSPYWVTFKQAREMGGNVKKGEKSTLVVFWKVLEKDNPKSPDNPDTFPVLRYYRVFNIAQCDNLDLSKLPDDAIDDAPDLDFSPIQACENVVKHFIKRPNILHNEQQAYYSPSRDIINMPKRETFQDEQHYYCVLFHELTHSTGHERRLNRPGITELAAFGSASYSKEELVAEMGAAFLSGMCDITNQTIENSAAYLQGWLKKLKSDKKLIVQAAAQAQKASDYILGE
jgi:antirestriction protein ArdC